MTTSANMLLLFDKEEILPPPPPPPPDCFLITADGGFVLLEDGSFVLIDCGAQFGVVTGRDSHNVVTGRGNDVVAIREA